MLLKKPLYLIPINSKQELSKKVMEFYKTKKKETIEEYAQDISSQQKIRINLKWNEKGLVNISTISGGFDLDKYGRRFMFHNIAETSEIGILLIKIANRYASLLMRD